MRMVLLITAAVLAFGGTMTVVTTDANAVVCARGVYRAGCAGAGGAVVVGRPAVVRPVVVRPAVVCRTVWVNGVRVRRCG
jgi:hypothetical protein